MSIESGSFDNQIAKITGNFNNPKCVAEAALEVQREAKNNAPAVTGDLRNNIYMNAETTDEGVTAEVYTPPGHYAYFVEVGTGRKGAENPGGISPNVSPAYKLEPWWIHESQIDPGVAERYHWMFIDTPDGRFYKCDGQAAQPFLYPALADNKQMVLDILRKGFNKALEAK